VSYRTDYDSWPWHGHKEQARLDAQNGRKNRDLYDRYDGEPKVAYAQAFDEETRRIEERKREEREAEEREEAQRNNAEIERQRQAQYEYEMEREEQRRQEEMPEEDSTP
jgi:hypothetical protein